jgi:molecular chaperone DnaK (HSP70)
VPSARDSDGLQWWLGIDLGTTAIAATLFNRQTQQHYPLYWSNPIQSDADRVFQLPSVGYFATQTQGRIPEHPTAIGYAALQAGTLSLSATGQITGLLLHSFKPYLNIALPYYSTQRKQWEPMIQRSESQTLPLIWVQQTLVSLLTSLTPTATGAAALVCQAQGLESAQFAAAIAQLAGVVINQPTGSSDAYRFNLREAVMAAGLVQNPEQIYCLEDGVAALLTELAQLEAGAGRKSEGRAGQKRGMLEGGVLVISAGAIATTMVLVDLPPTIRELSQDELAVRRIAYAGNALDQDIICQLLRPFAQNWEALDLDSLNLPLPGAPDLEPRYRLQQRLESLPLGRSLLSSVRQVKPTLCQQDVTYVLDTQRWNLRRSDLLNWVILPYLQQLNRELNSLLTQTRIPAAAVRRVLCTGGTATIDAVTLWVRQKFPHAQVVVDQSSQQSLVAMQRIAQGLAQFPNFPGVFNRDRHFYSDFFLLRTLLEHIPQDPDLAWSTSGIIELLATQGIPSSISQPFVLNLLEGHLPTGLVPSMATGILLTPESRHNPDYDAIAASPLFERDDAQQYRLNLPQRDRLWNYLQAILTNTHQTLQTPLEAVINS